jgi:hypothetical protein
MVKQKATSVADCEKTNKWRSDDASRPCTAVTGIEIHHLRAQRLIEYSDEPSNGGPICRIPHRPPRSHSAAGSFMTSPDLHSWSEGYYNEQRCEPALIPAMDDVEKYLFNFKNKNNLAIMLHC